MDSLKKAMKEKRKKEKETKFQLSAVHTFRGLLDLWDAHTTLHSLSKAKNLFSIPTRKGEVGLKERMQRKKKQSSIHNTFKMNKM